MLTLFGLMETYNVVVRVHGAKKIDSAPSLD